MCKLYTHWRKVRQWRGLFATHHGRVARSRLRLCETAMAEGHHNIEVGGGHYSICPGAVLNRSPSASRRYSVDAPEPGTKMSKRRSLHARSLFSLYRPCWGQEERGNCHDQELGVIGHTGGRMGTHQDSRLCRKIIQVGASTGGVRRKSSSIDARRVLGLAQ